MLIGQNAGGKTLILQASSPAVSDTLFDSSQAERAAKSNNLFSGCLSLGSLPLISVPVLPEVRGGRVHCRQDRWGKARHGFVYIYNGCKFSGILIMCLQVDQHVRHQLHAIVPLLDMFKTEQ